MCSGSWFWGYWAWYPLVVRDIPKFAKVEGVPGIFVLGIYCVLLHRVSMGETQSSVKILP